MFGLIGENLSYSLSKKIHESIREMTYELIELSQNELNEFMLKKEFKGINVTIPYKETVLPYLDYIHEEAKAIGAVNTILNIDGHLQGYNTDIYGFQSLIDSIDISLEGSKILILGSGATSKTVSYTLSKYFPKEILKVSRTPKEKNEITYEEAYKLTDIDLIVNTTPIGTFPNINEKPIDLISFGNLKGVIDLVYNPRETALLKEARLLNIPCVGGIDMLYIQAVFANELFAKVMDTITPNYMTIYPTKVHGIPDLPSSKSLCHRSIIAASLGKSKSTLFNISFSDDIIATMEAMKSIGAKFEIIKDKVIVFPVNFSSLPQNIVINCKESGSTLRFLIPIVSALGIKTKFTGSKKLFSRPLDTYKDLFEEEGLLFQLNTDSLTVDGLLSKKDFIIDTSKSSQFATGILFALPLIGGGSLKLTSLRESYSYIDLTVDVIRSFGVNVEVSEDNIYIDGSFKWQDYTVETDLSQMAFFAVLAAINAPLTFKDINMSSLQGDKVILEILESMGARFDYKDGTLTISPGLLSATTIDISNCPDLAPILIILGLFASNKTILTNTHRLKYKESPRDLAMQEELEKLGIYIEVEENRIIIEGGQKITKQSKVHAHNDHRIAMALTILGLSSSRRIEIDNFDSVNKSFQNFRYVVSSITT